MNINSLHRLVSLLMLVILPSVLTMAEANNAMLNANGAVTINGTAAGKSLPVFGGDKVQTLKQGTAIISNGGMTVHLPADSSIVYQENNIELNQGAAVITTKKATTGRLSDLSVSPTSPNATKFALVNQPGTETIAAIEGSLRITDGTNTVELLPGQTLTHTPNSMAQPNTISAATNEQEAPTGAQEQTPRERQEPVPAARGHKFGRIPNWEIGVIAASVAAAAIIAVVVHDEVTEPASPSNR